MEQRLDAPVLKGKSLIPGDASKHPSDLIYDEQSQFWISRATGMPFVKEVMNNRLNQLHASRFGETILTDAVEGTDRPGPNSNIFASNFGETLITKTSEGSDQTEIASFSSRFGETLITRTEGEGSDR